MTRSSQPRRLIRAAAAVTAIGLASSLATVGSLATIGATAAGASSYGFNRPMAIAVNGSEILIANNSGNSVTETTTSGAWIRTLTSATYGFHQPDAIVNYLGNSFVVNHTGSVTEINAASGALVRIISGATYGFSSPTAAKQQGGHIWVVNTGSNSVTEFSATTGAFIRRLTDTSGSYDFKTPDAITVAGVDLWVTSKTGGSTTNASLGAATEFTAATGAFVRRISTATDGLNKPSGIAFDGTHLWITDAGTNAVTELAASGVLTRIVTNSSLDENYGFDAPTVVVSSAPYVYVVSPPGSSPMVTQITASTAEGNWYECNTNTPDPDFVNPTGMIVNAGSVWVVSPGDNTLTQLSLADGGNRVNLFT
jgi:hypothetical protein